MRLVAMPDFLLTIPTVILHACLRARFILNLVGCLAFGWSAGAVVVYFECELACEFECTCPAKMPQEGSTKEPLLEHGRSRHTQLTAGPELGSGQPATTQGLDFLHAQPRAALQSKLQGASKRVCCRPATLNASGLLNSNACC